MINRFEIQDVLDYIAGEMPSEIKEQFEAALHTDELLKEQYDSMLRYEQNILNNSKLTLTEQWVSNSYTKISELIAESNFPKPGDVYRLSGGDDIVVVSAEQLTEYGLIAYRVVPLTSNDTFAEKHDVVFRDNGYQNRVAVAHTHLAFGLLGTIPGIKRGKLNTNLLAPLNQLSYGSQATLPEGATFGEGVHTALRESYNVWFEVSSERYHSISMKNLQEHEDKQESQLISDTPIRVSLEKRLLDAIFSRVSSTTDKEYLSAAASQSTSSLLGATGKTIFDDEKIRLRVEQLGEQSPVLTLTFKEHTSEIEEISIETEGKAPIVKMHLMCVDNEVTLPLLLNENDKNTTTTLIVKTKQLDFRKTFIFESE